MSPQAELWGGLANSRNTFDESTRCTRYTSGSVRGGNSIAFTHTHTQTLTNTHSSRDPTHLFNDDEVSNLDVRALHLHGPCKETGPSYIMPEFTSIPRCLYGRPAGCRCFPASTHPSAASSPPAPLRRGAPATHTHGCRDPRPSSDSFRPNGASDACLNPESFSLKKKKKTTKRHRNGGGS